MNSRHALLLAVVLPCAAPAVAQVHYDVHQKELDNGLRVLVLEDASCPIVAVQVWYHVGSKDEDPERQGFAHMFEHMMFRGTDRLGPEDHFRYVRGAGGDCNAYTSFDNTTYVQVVPSDQLAMVLWLEAERMSALRVDEAGFHTERRVVAEERRLGLNQPYGSVLERLLERVFTRHPYRWSPIGQIEHLERATSEELLRFWETYYVPNNAVLVVVGQVQAKQVFAAAERAFGWIPRCPEPPRVTVEEPLREEPLYVELEETRGPVPIVAVAYRTVPQHHPDALPLEMLMSILGGGQSSRIYRRLVDDEEKAAVAMAGAMNLEQAGIAAAGALTLPFGDLDGCIAALDEELARVREHLVDEAELDKARAEHLRNMVDESRTVESKARLLGTAALFHGGPEWLNGRAERVNAVTREDLQRVARTYFVPERRITVKVKPTVGGMLRSLLGGRNQAKPEDAAPERGLGDPAASAEPASPMAERRGPKADAKRPEGYPEAPPVAPTRAVAVHMDAHTRVLDNGLRVEVIENHEVPVVSMRLGLLAGAYLDEPGKEGAAAMACAMLTRGTRRHTAQELAAELESRAISLSASAAMDSASVTGSAGTAQFPRLAGFLAEVVLEPTFPAGEFEKLRRQLLTGKSIAEKQPSAIAERFLRQGLWGRFFYARDPDGSSEELKALQPAAPAAWWARCARPDQAVLYVAGDVAPDDAFDLADALFGGWEAEGDPPRPWSPAPPDAERTAILLLDTPGAIQGEIRVGQSGFRRSDPRHALGSVFTQAFGGAFNSRLNKVLRVQKGLTYGARGGLRPMRFGGEFTVATFSKTATVAEAVATILEEIRRVREQPFTEEEIEQARSYLVGSFAGDHETPEAIAAARFGLVRDGLPDDFYERWLEAVVKATSADVVALAEELIDPDRLRVVVVGDAAQLEPPLRAVAPVTVADEEGRRTRIQPRDPADGE